MFEDVLMSRKSCVVRVLLLRMILEEEDLLLSGKCLCYCSKLSFNLSLALRSGFSPLYFYSGVDSYDWSFLLLVLIYLPW